MLRWTRGQRAMFADKLPDAANLALGALVFGQVLSDGAFSVSLGAFGLLLWTALMAYAAILAGGVK